MVLTRVEQSRCWSMINVPSLMHVVYEVTSMVATSLHYVHSVCVVSRRTGCWNQSGPGRIMLGIGYAIATDTQSPIGRRRLLRRMNPQGSWFHSGDDNSIIRNSK